jgi:hypothetical protein
MDKPIVIIPFTLPWDWSADFQRQTCLELGRRGYNVYAYMHDDAYFFLRKKKVNWPKLNNIKFYQPPYLIPFRRISFIEKVNRLLSLYLFSLKLGFAKKIIWIFDPQFFDFSKYFFNKKSLYDCVDFHQENSALEKKLIGNVDKI